MEMTEFTVADLSRMFDLVPATVKKYIKKAEIQPVRKQGSSIYYDVNDVLWFKPKVQSAMKIQTAGDYDIEQERARETKERADNMELKNAQLRRELIPVDLMSWTLGTLGSQISAVLESLPVKLKRRMPKFGATELDIVKGEVAKCQNIASELSVDFDGYDQS